MVTKKVTITLPVELAEAARNRSDETGVPVSAAIQRLLAEWVAGGELPKPQAQPATSGKAAARKRKATPKA